MSKNQTSRQQSPDVDVQIRRAFTLHQQGKLADAERIYTEILQRVPNHFGALSLLGAIACQSGAYERAVTLLSKAISINPNVAPAHSNLAVALRELKRFKEALISCDRAIALKSDYVEAYYSRGLILKELGRIENALSSFDKALSIKPDPEAHYSRGNALRELNRFEDALWSYEKAIVLNPNFAEAHFNRGNALRELSRPQEALVSYERAIALKPDFAEVHHNRAVVLNELDQLDEFLASYERAIALRPNDAECYSDQAVVLQKLRRLNQALDSYDKAIALRPDLAEVCYNRGNILRELGRLEEACDSFRQASALQPDFIGAYNSMGLCLQELGQLDKAQDAFRKALDIDPRNAAIYNNIGLCLLELGQFEKARDAFRKVLDIEPRNASALSNLSHAKKVEAGDPNLDVMQELLANPELLSDSERIELNFALGKAYADLKDHRRSFEHLLVANQAKRAIFPYDEQAALSAFDLLERTFSRDLIKSKSGYGDSSRQPIFIVGMPRSGTTLVEQILASHPEVYGAGELEALRRTAQVMYRAGGTTVPYPYFVPALDLFALAGLGARYLAAINEGGPKNEHVTDKMLANSMFVGLIHLILPNAKIIHTTRDPIDNCVSCFSILFTKGQNFTYDLGELGRYYKRYERLMAHWHDVLPPGRILDVKYEDVVADIGEQARRILSYCELPWDDRCLSFYESNRPVRTASLAQVRRPIYSSAVGRWHDYEEFIGPLLAALGVDGMSSERHIPQAT